MFFSPPRAGMPATAIGTKPWHDSARTLPLSPPPPLVTDADDGADPRAGEELAVDGYFAADA